MNLLYLHHTIAYILGHWPSILSYSINGISIAVGLQYLKRRFKIDQKSVRIIKLVRLDGPQIVTIMLTVFAAIDTATTYLIDPMNAQYVPKYFSLLLTAAFFIHRFMVSPLGLKIETVLRPYWQAVEQIRQTEQRTAATTAPAPVTQPFTLDQSK